MTSFLLPYGKAQLTITIPEEIRVDILTPQIADGLADPESAIREVLSKPIGKVSWQAFTKTETVGIAINDKTRPVPNPNPINHLLDHLNQVGFQSEQITLFIGSGTHEPMTSAELDRILDQEIFNSYRIVAHDCDHSNLVNLGNTAYGTPIQINEEFFHSDLKIAVGNIEPHHFMGFSGGVKTAAIGLAGRATITENHARLTHPQAKSGVFHINPLRQEVEEIGRKAGIHLTLGTILNEDKSILEIYFGEPSAVMSAAIPMVRRLFGISVPKPYDLVIASPGGAPKDINLYQSQKGLTHAARITRDDGWVILLAACSEGSGSQTYEKYIKQAASHQSIIQHFKRGFFKVGPHKALQIARDALRVNVMLVSDLDPQTVKDWKITPSKPELLDELIKWIVSKLPPTARIAILPAATRTMTEVIYDKQ